MRSANSVNANIAIVAGFTLHPNADEARRRGMDGGKLRGREAEEAP